MILGGWLSFRGNLARDQSMGKRIGKRPGFYPLGTLHKGSRDHPGGPE